MLAKAEPADGDREPVMLLFSNIDLANDECDFGTSNHRHRHRRKHSVTAALWLTLAWSRPGMGLELGLDLWGFSLTYTGPATRFLSLACVVWVLCASVGGSVYPVTRDRDFVCASLSPCVHVPWRGHVRRYTLLRRPGFGRIVVAHSEARDSGQLSQLGE